MMMFLSILCASAVVLAVLVAVFSTIEPTEHKGIEMGIPARPAKFFAADSLRSSAHDDLAIDVMLAQIERHVRLEQAAAESFLDVPTPETLHSGTSSPLAN